MPDSSDSNGWRPIASAPMRETVLLYLPHTDRVVLGRRDDNKGYELTRGMWRVVYSPGATVCYLGAQALPTHWQPLPPPPAEGDR